MAKHKGSLLRQLTLSLGLAIVFLSLASFCYQYRVEKRILTGSICDDLRNQANQLRTRLGQAETTEERDAIASQYIETLGHLGEGQREVVVVDKDSRIVASNGGQEPGQPAGSEILREAMAPGGSSGEVCREAAGKYIIALPCYADAADARINGGVLLKQPLTAVAHLANRLMLSAFVALAVTLVVIVLVVYAVLRLKVHKPMHAIFMQEYRIREGDLARIEAEDPGNEFSDLYAMYNEMVVRIAEQKKAILDQKDHAALAHLVRQAIAQLTAPLDEILAESRTLLEHQSSVSEADQNTLKQIIAHITRIARELKSIVVEGDKSTTWLRREAKKIREYKKVSGGEEKDEGKQGLE